MAILGGIFVDNDAIDTVHEILTPDSFYREAHRQIFKAMAALADRNESVDLITMTTELKSRGRLEEVGGGAYLATLVDFVPMAANIAHYCRIVVQNHQKRRLLSNAQEAMQILYDGGDVDEAITRMETAMQPVLDKRSSLPVGMEQAVREAVKRIEQRHENQGKIQGLPYGIAELDEKTSGMHPGELIIIAGRPSMGKSALAGNILANTGASGRSALLFTLEMKRDDIVDRIAAGHGRIRYQNIRSGQLREGEWSKITKVMSDLFHWKLTIDDTPGVTLRDVRAKAHRMKKEGLDLIVLDYLQLMTPSNTKDSRTQAIGEISRGLKQLARELNVPVVLLSQLNRSVDMRPDKRPVMSDLRDSGEIEQDADVILFPYRPAAYCAQCRVRYNGPDHNFREHQAKAEIIIEKQRAGERYITIPVCWIGEYQRFEGLEEEGV